MTDRGEMAKRFYFQAKMMSLGMGVAVFVYGALAYYLIRMGKGGPAILDSQTYCLVQYGLLAFSVVGIFMMYRLRERILSVVPTREGAPSGDPQRHPQKLFLAMVLMMAAAEMPVLFGLLLVFLGRNFYVFLPFAALSVAGFYFAFPKKQQWEEWLGMTF